MSGTPGRKKSIAAYILTGISIPVFIYAALCFSGASGLLHSGSLVAVFFILLVPLLWFSGTITVILSLISLIILAKTLKIVENRTRRIVNTVILVINSCLIVASVLFFFLL